MNAFRVLLASAALLVVIGGVALSDHSRKSAAMHDASIAQWICSHKGERCDERDQRSVEAAWTRRERAYGAAFAAVGLLGAWAYVRWRRPGPSPERR